MTFSRRSQNDFKVPCRDVIRRPCKDVIKILSRCFQDIFKMYHQVKQLLLTRILDVFKAFSRCIQHVFETYCKGNYWHKDLPRPHVREIYDQSANFPRVNSFNITNKFKQFLKHFMKWLLLQIKIFFIKAGIRKYGAALVIKESMDKCITKDVFPRFQLFT